jgi:hypothetical protein
MNRHGLLLTLSPRRLALCLAAIGVFSSPALAAKLEPAAVKAWDQYLKWADQKVERELSDLKGFLIQNYLSPQDKATVQRQLAAGEAVVRRMQGVVPSGTKFSVPDAAIHHWWGSIIVPHIMLADLLKFLQDYDHHAGRFAEVVQSKLLSKQDEKYKFFFRLKRSKSFVTVHYNTEQECVYRLHDSKRASSRSIATKIAEIKDAETPQERELPPGDDSGYLWRLVTCWRFRQVDNDVVVECESASLSRSIPGIVNWIPGLRGYLESVPYESLHSTLIPIRKLAKPSQ